MIQEILNIRPELGLSVRRFSNREAQVLARGSVEQIKAILNLYREEREKKRREDEIRSNEYKSPGGAEPQTNGNHLGEAEASHGANLPNNDDIKLNDLNNSVLNEEITLSGGASNSQNNLAQQDGVSNELNNNVLNDLNNVVGFNDNELNDLGELNESVLNELNKEEITLTGLNLPNDDIKLNDNEEIVSGGGLIGGALNNEEVKLNENEEIASGGGLNNNVLNELNNKEVKLNDGNDGDWEDIYDTGDRDNLEDYFEDEPYGYNGDDDGYDGDNYKLDKNRFK